MENVPETSRLHRKPATSSNYLLSLCYGRFLSRIIRLAEIFSNLFYNDSISIMLENGSDDDKLNLIYLYICMFTLM